jgi:hypothetical protein
MGTDHPVDLPPLDPIRDGSRKSCCRPPRLIRSRLRPPASNRHPTLCVVSVGHFSCRGPGGAVRTDSDIRRKPTRRFRARRKQPRRGSTAAGLALAGGQPHVPGAKGRRPAHGCRRGGPARADDQGYVRSWVQSARVNLSLFGHDEDEEIAQACLANVARPGHRQPVQPGLGLVRPRVGAARPPPPGGDARLRPWCSRDVPPVPVSWHRRCPLGARSVDQANGRAPGVPFETTTGRSSR